MQTLRRGISRACLQPHHTNFFHIRRLEVVRLDLLGVYIFSVGEDDDFLAPPGDKQIASGIEVAEIAGVEPAVAQRLGCGLGAIPISLHHECATDHDLTHGRRAFLGRLRVHDLLSDGLFFDNLVSDNSGFDPGKRRSDRAKYDRVPRRVDESAA